ncbi:hypothetical protein IE81DRAFT_319345 [Ceraceosorus guamensis]|uniref:Uncharacterized protein n=1 Tax=Ceraceosorus guamensis TaxID=1522189 RepID=A0A316W934_9BASI|nr:hypothetical protein IE81DRAFT_319345 [Ceraceosorus guamensis]PWN46440.1 hypothetical protein IE81DRAFT_319345 [Ceraceosorus guamensis]
MQSLIRTFAPARPTPRSAARETQNATWVYSGDCSSGTLVTRELDDCMETLSPVRYDRTLRQATRRESWKARMQVHFDHRMCRRTLPIIRSIVITIECTLRLNGWRRQVLLSIDLRRCKASEGREPLCPSVILFGTSLGSDRLRPADPKII